MLNKSLYLSNKIFNKPEMEATRDGYGLGLVDAGQENENVFVLAADLTESTRSNFFKEKFPNRFVQLGVSEQALATVASGMANYGKIPYISSYAMFSPGRNWEQIRTTIALNNVNVKIGGAHAGLTVGPDGATHQALEDISLMRVMPNMMVFSPCDMIEAKKITYEASKINKPCYIRFAREKTALITSDKTPFKAGKIETFWEDNNPMATIIATGPILYEALIAANELRKKKIGVQVLNCHTIKPIDEQAIIKAAKISEAIVTVEEHQVTGGLGEAISHVLVKNYPVPQEFVGVQDRFGQSGKPKELLKEYGLTYKDIMESVMRVIKRKNS